ncbi:hypothetical protein [Rhizobium sp. SGZ-381]|uniref:hypothetical protein n=1 Tax=Rhizobium sp. SGZ-381 TaxID=3342800 RepID=UPI00366F7924
MPDFSFFGVAPLDPKRFAAMTPALQTEAVLLMVERGEGFARIMSATGLDWGGLTRLRSAKPLFRLEQFDRVEKVSGALLSPEECEARRKGFAGSNAAKVLAFLHGQAGPLRISLRRIEEGAGIGASSGTLPMRLLQDLGFLERLEPPRGLSPALWQLTPEGVRAADDLLTKAAPHGR